MAEQSRRSPGVLSRADAADASAEIGDLIDEIVAQPLVNYRTPPESLEDEQILAELEWIGDAVTWPGEVGEHARARTASLCREWMRRQGVSS